MSVRRPASGYPPGYEHIRESRVIGHGTSAIETAADQLLRWELHRGSGLAVATTALRVVPDAEVLLGFGVGALRLAIPCRVVYLVEEPARRGFAYGTLTGHPESGEELFVVALGNDGQVTTEVTAFSRPALLVVTAGQPSRAPGAACCDSALSDGSRLTRSTASHT